MLLAKILSVTFTLFDPNLQFFFIYFSCNRLDWSSPRPDPLRLFIFTVNNVNSILTTLSPKSAPLERVIQLHERAGALSYAELGTILDGSGGEYTYFLETFGPLIPKPVNIDDDPSSDTSEGRRTPAWKGYPAKNYRGAWYKPLPAFLYSWVSILLLKPSSLAIITMTFAEYVLRLSSLGCTNFIAPATAVRLIAGSCISESAFYSWILYKFTD